VSRSDPADDPCGRGQHVLDRGGLAVVVAEYPRRRKAARGHDREPGRLDDPGRGRVPGVWQHERIAGHVQRTQRGGLLL
jgi:hypothetical protein